MMSDRDYSVFAEVAKRYAQATPVTTNTPPDMDPNALQEGQSIYDNTDKEYVVLKSDDMEQNKVIVPKDQLQQGTIPGGVQTVDESDLSTNYQLQPGSVQKASSVLREFKTAQEETDWNDLLSEAIDFVAYTRKQDVQGIIEQLDRLNKMVLELVGGEDFGNVEDFLGKASSKSGPFESWSRSTEELAKVAEIKGMDDLVGALLSSDKDSSTFPELIKTAGGIGLEDMDLLKSIWLGSSI